MSFRIVLLLLFLAARTAVHAELPTVEISKIFEDSSGGSLTRASQVQINGKRVFLKSNKGSPSGTRYANFESDILSKRIFERVGIRCPDARMVRIGSAPKLEYGGTLGKYLGQDALAMEFVNTRFASGRVYSGGWPDGDKADVDLFIDLFVVDVIIGNADRRVPNLFVGVRYGEAEGKEGPGSHFPIPIDNNSGFGTLVVWNQPSAQNIVLDSTVHRKIVTDTSLHERILKRASKLVALLDDAFIDEIVAELPREIIPRGLKVDPAEGEWRSKFTASELKLLFGDQVKALSGQELFAHRKSELSRRFKWRRDHALAALAKFLATESQALPQQTNW
jgi:hypothetical protein